MRSLPGWARDFLKQSYDGPAASQNAAQRPPQPRLEQLSIDQEGAAPGSAAQAPRADWEDYPPFRAGKPDGAPMSVWSAPGYAGPEAARAAREAPRLSHKEKPGEAEARQAPLRVSDAELSRMANRIYGIIEDRLRREKRRSGQ